SRPELLTDLQQRAELDQSILFQKVCREENDQLGGEPYGVLVADEAFGPDDEDVTLLRQLAQLAAATPVVLLAEARPEMFQVRQFGELAAAQGLADLFQQDRYAAWNQFRQREEARFVGLTLPRVLARLPYGARWAPVAALALEEAMPAQELAAALWTNGV